MEDVGSESKIKTFLQPNQIQLINLIMFLKTLLPLLLAAPFITAELDQVVKVERRQYIAANDLDTGNCKDTMFIFARGSTEVGNEVSSSSESTLPCKASALNRTTIYYMLYTNPVQGTVVGPEVCDDLKMKLGGNLGCQGIGGAYTAGLAENFLPDNTAPQDVQAAVDVFNKCNTKCPKAKIVAGGYRYVHPTHSHPQIYLAQSNPDHLQRSALLIFLQSGQRSHRQRNPETRLWRQR